VRATPVIWDVDDDPDGNMQDILEHDLTRARKKAGMSLAAVSELSGIDRAALSRLENGRQSNPTVSTLYRYAAALGKELVWSVVGLFEIEFGWSPGFSRLKPGLQPTIASKLTHYRTTIVQNLRAPRRFLSSSPPYQGGVGGGADCPAAAECTAEGSGLMDAFIDSAQRPPLPPLLKGGSGRALWVAGFPR